MKHEIQHAVQDVAGMARGGSPAEFSVADRNGVREILKDGTVVMDDGFVSGSSPDAGVKQREKLQVQGFDGFWYTGDEMGGPSLAELGAFESNQVKSATGNSGGFSADPDIFWFSRGAESSRNADVDLRRLVAGMEPLGHATVGDAKVMEAARAIADDPARLRALASNVRSGSQKSIASEERVALQIGDQRVFSEYASLSDSLAEALANGNVAQAGVTLVHGF